MGWGRGGSVHVKEKANAKSPETGTFLRNSKKASVAGVEYVTENSWKWCPSGVRSFRAL